MLYRPVTIYCDYNWLIKYTGICVLDNYDQQVIQLNPQVLNSWEVCHIFQNQFHWLPQENLHPWQCKYQVVTLILKSTSNCFCGSVLLSWLPWYATILISVHFSLVVFYCVRCSLLVELVNANACSVCWKLYQSLYPY